MRPAIGSRRRQPGTRQTIMAACYGDTQPCGTAMPPLISASAMSHQEKLSHGSRIKDSQFMACQLLISVYICASLLRGQGAALTGGRRVTGAFSLSPVPWARVPACPVATTQITSDHIFIPNHCIVSNFRVKNVLRVRQFSVFIKPLLDNVFSCLVRMRSTEF